MSETTTNNKVKQLLAKVSLADKEHESLSKKKYTIPRPYFFRKMAESGNYPNENFRMFVEENIDQIMSDNWLSWKNFNDDYIRTMKNKRLFSVISQEADGRNDDKENFKDELKRQTELILNSKRIQGISKDTIDTLESL